jgi:hypothetical protein
LSFSFLSQHTFRKIEPMCRMIPRS